MQLFSQFRRPTPVFYHVCEWMLLLFMIASVVWKGGKSLEMTWLLVGIASLLSITSVWDPRETSSVPRYIWWSVLMFFLLTVLSFIVSSTKNYGFDEVLRTGALTLLFLWTFRRSTIPEEGEQFVQRLVRTLSYATLFTCAVGMIVYVFQPVNRFVGTFFDIRFHTDYWPNAWASYLLLTWPIVLYWALHDFSFDRHDLRSRIELLLRSATVGVVFSCLFLSYSRGGILVLGIQCLLWLGIVLWKLRSQFLFRNIVPVSFIIVVISISGFIGMNNIRSHFFEVQQVTEKVTFTADEGLSSISERASFWKQSIQLFHEQPVFGWGPYSFRFVQPKLQNHILATSDHPHNIVLKILVERGIGSAVLFIFLIFTIIFRILQSLLQKHIETGTLFFSIRMMLFLGVVGVLLHSMIDYNLQFVGIALPLWMFIGVLIPFTEKHSSPHTSQKIPRLCELCIAVTMLSFAIYEGVYIVQSSVGRHAEVANNTDAALHWYALAEEQMFPRDLHLSQAQLYIQNGEYDLAQRALHAYFKLNPHDPRVWKIQGELYSLQNDLQKAISAYQTAYNLGAFNDIGILLGLVQSYIESNQHADLLQRKTEIEDVLQKYVSAIDHNVHYIALSQNVEDCITLANLLSQIFPESAPKYEVWAAKVDFKSRIERERLSSRPPGYLW